MTPPPFSTFLEQHRVDVYRYLTALVGPDRADDCFQETFLAALRAYPRLRPGTNLRAWILTIAGRKAIDDGRGRARRPLPVGDLPERGTAPPDDGEPELWRAVRNLPPKQRDALVHRYVLDLSYREVGEALGCSEDAARASAHEGRKRLRKELALIGDREEET